MDETIAFDKSLKQRLDEYNEIFQDLSETHIRRAWTLHFELSQVDPSGWQALWKIPRLVCESLNMPFPTAALVLVLRLDFYSLKALVRVLAVPDDVSLPDKYTVDIAHLWPTREQDKSIALNIIDTANGLDVYRFFYKHVFMPWDEDGETADWMYRHLENRLRLHYDLKNGSIPRSVAEYVQSLMIEARSLSNKREMLETQICKHELSDEESCNFSEDLKTLFNDTACRLLQIRDEIKIYEDPVLRDVLIKRRLDEEFTCKNESRNVWAISHHCTADAYIQFLDLIIMLYPEQMITPCTSLAGKLEVTRSRDTFLLNESDKEHFICTPGALQEGGVIRGVGQRNMIVLTSSFAHVLIDAIGGEVYIENLTIEAKSSQCAILVRRGKCVLRNCKIIGDGVSSTHQGIVLLEGAELHITDCDLTKFYTAILGNSRSKITLKNCNIDSCVVGLKLEDNSFARLEDSNFGNCYKFGIRVDSEKDEEGVTGDFDILERMPDITMKNISGSKNSLSNAGIFQRQKLVPVADLFSNPDLDPTIIESADESEAC